ncbi:MAG: DNA mismatch repair protein MutS [Clostridia bacterium]|nr:DNA mismatch repair protein MutS [Clostridia bacterium]
MNGLTPMMQQYLTIKQQYRDCILFFRLGDFYEMFFEDAEEASGVLEITLTGRDGGLEQRIPMCGVPYHSADNYIARLVDRGYKVAICEQVEDPREAKGIVKRDVVRVITPGTILDTNVLDEKLHNYIVSITWGEGYGLAVADVTTGFFGVTQLTGQRAERRLVDELGRLNPAEIVLDDRLEQENLVQYLRSMNKVALSFYPAASFREQTAVETLCRHFGTRSLDGYGCREYPLGTCAAGALLDFLHTTQKNDLNHLNRLNVYSTSNFMFLDSATRRNLELTRTIRDGSRKGTLLWVLDNTVTAMGGRLLKNWLEQPLIEAEAIRGRLEANSELAGDTLLRTELLETMEEIYDLERLVGRVAYGTANARDLVALKVSLAALPKLQALLTKTSGFLLQALHKELDLLEDMKNLIQEAIIDEPPFSIREGGLIKTGFHPEVDRLRSATTDGKQWIAALEARERERTGIKSLKVGYNKVFGYYIEVTRSNLGAVPDDFIRKQTLANAERYITPELKEQESVILGAEDKITQQEYEIFCQIRDTIKDQSTRIQQTAGVIARVDALCSLAEAAVRGNYTKPIITDKGKIEIKEGRHPVVEKMLQQEWFIPNDTLLDDEVNRLLIITGPNMAGKSTYMRQVALITLMAQCGSFVPATEAVIGVVDRIFTRVGASDDLATGQSTFMVEMNEVANILNNATSRSLIILDEIGRGTSTFDGLSIAWAVAEYIHDPKRIGAKTLFATHYHELTELSELHSGVQNYSIAVKEKGEDIIFLRKIIPGGADRSYGIQVARLAGLPPEVIKRSKEILLTLEAQENMGKGQRGIASAKEDLDWPVLAVNETPASPITGAAQLQLFPEVHPVLKELAGLAVLNMTPLEALNKLFELQDRYLKDSGER